MSEENKRVARPVSQEELYESFSVPAPSTNRFFVHIDEAGLRMAFAEQVPGAQKLYFRSAATLSLSDGIQLYKVLQEMLKPLEEGIETAKASAATAGQDG